MPPSTRLVPMSQRDLHRYHTLRLVLEHRLTGAEAAPHLRGLLVALEFLAERPGGVSVTVAVRGGPGAEQAPPARHRPWAGAA